MGLRPTLQLLKEYRTWQVKIKLDMSCLECGRDHPAGLVFHHLDPSEKRFEVGHPYRLLKRSPTFSEFSSEVEKCVILCAYCHRLVHASSLELNEEKAKAQKKQIRKGLRKIYKKLFAAANPI
jgi:hypothetical protein